LYILYLVEEEPHMPEVASSVHEVMVAMKITTVQFDVISDFLNTAKGTWNFLNLKTTFSN
jgi:hypothetical protein